MRWHQVTAQPPRVVGEKDSALSSARASCHLQKLARRLALAITQKSILAVCSQQPDMPPSSCNQHLMSADNSLAGNPHPAKPRP
jgi:hypothetical protein